jgi:NAD(P)-dependent dehydrogenase (short-subunit alcohol dehydrogenase family)
MAGPGQTSGPGQPPPLALGTGCVVITGGGGRIGRGLALAFARRGAAVVVADLNAAAAEAVAAQVAAVPGARARPVAADVSDRASMDALAATACDAFGEVRVLCNNAGLAVLGPFAELTQQDWDRVLGVQLHGVLNGTYAFLPRLIAQPGRSHIVNTSSMSGLGRADLRLANAPYVTAKFAVTGLSELMRPALAEHGIGVSVLCPGFTRDDPDSVTSFPMPSADWYRDNLLSPDQVAQETIAGILENRLHIFPHRAGRQEVIDRHQLLLAGFEAAEATSPPLGQPARTAGQPEPGPPDSLPADSLPGDSLPAETRPAETLPAETRP